MKKFMVGAVLLAAAVAQLVVAAEGDVTPANASFLILPTTSLNVTNGQAVAVTGSHYVLTGIGGADDTTNTVTVTAPTAANTGLIVVLTVAAASTNLVTIADSDPMSLAGAWVADNNDTITLMSLGAKWVELNRANN